MNLRRRLGLLWGIATLLIVGMVAAVAYLAGVAAGGTAHAVGLGFGFFWLLPFLFILFLVSRVFRGGRGWYGRGWYGARGMYDRGPRGVPPMFDQWHQQAHGQTPAEVPAQQTPGQTTAPPPLADDPWR